MNTILLCIMISFYYSLHSFLAHEKVKKALFKFSFVEKYYRILFNIISIGLLIPIAWVFQNTKTEIIFNQHQISNTGIFIAIIGFILILFALKQYNLSEFSGIEQLKSQNHVIKSTLKKSGFNNLVRHPLYFATLLVLFGWLLYYPTTKTLLVVFISILYLIIGTKLEEKKLVLEFGKEYLEYKKQVPMLIPSLKKLFSLKNK